MCGEMVLLMRSMYFGLYIAEHKLDNPILCCPHCGDLQTTPAVAFDGITESTMKRLLSLAYLEAAEYVNMCLTSYK